MLVNFEDYTHELTAVEVSVAKSLHLVLLKQNGVPITAKQLIARFKSRPVDMFPNFRLDEPRIRKMINFLCNTQMPNLIGTSKGYFVTSDVEELKRATGTLISRANENQRRADILVKLLSKSYGVRL